MRRVMNPRCEGVARFAVATFPQVERPYLESNCELFRIVTVATSFYWVISVEIGVAPMALASIFNMELWYCGRFLLE